METNKDISIAKQVAIEVAIIVAEKLNKSMTEEDLFKISNHYTKFISLHSKDKDSSIKCQSALRRAAMASKILDINNTKGICDLAEKFFNYF